MSGQMKINELNIGRSPLYGSKFDKEVLPLYMDRAGVTLKRVRGKTVPFSEKFDYISFLPPLMKVDDKVTDFGSDGPSFGQASGQRSAIVNYYDNDHRHCKLLIKGCGNGAASIDTKVSRSGQPLGGQTRSACDHELKMTGEINDCLRSNGYVSARIPMGRFDYMGISFEGEPCSASLYKIHGDTRLDELLYPFMGIYHNDLSREEWNALRFGRIVSEDERDRTDDAANEFKKIILGLGRATGSLLCTLYDSGYVWGTSVLSSDDGTTTRFATNAHIGNLVVFPELAGFETDIVIGGRQTTNPSYYVGKVRTGIVDFDSVAVDVARKVGIKRNDIIEKEKDLLIGSMSSMEAAIIAKSGSNLTSEKLSTYMGPITRKFEEGFSMGLEKGGDLAPIDFNPNKILLELIKSHGKI